MDRRSAKRKKEDRFFPSVSAKKHVEELEQILKNVILKNRSEYAILCGPSGCGKSAVIEKALGTYKNGILWNSFHYIVLDGTVHGSPRASVDEVLRQTGIGKMKADGNAAGTAAEKLDEMCRFLAEAVTADPDESRIENTKQKVGYIFVIEHVEGLIEQNNQMLLYNLFDMAHSQDIPVCVLATSTAVDVMEKMEKRVKSRFSQRVINVAMDLFVDLQEYKAAIAFSASLTLKVDLKSAAETIDERRVCQQTHFQTFVCSECWSKPADWKYGLDSSHFFAVEQALDDSDLSSSLQTLHDSKRDWNTVYRIVCLAYAHTTTDPPVLEPAHFLSACRMLLADATVSTIMDLPFLHLALVLSCFEYASAQDQTTFNCCMIEEVYVTATKQKLKSFRFGRHLVAAAFQDLEDCGLLKPAARTKNEPPQFRMLSLNIARVQLREALRRMDLNSIPTDLRSWCKDFV